MSGDKPANASQKATGDERWRDMAKGMLKAELKRENLTYEDLAAKMAAIGLDESEGSIRNKISRGTFTFAFALQALAAIGVDLVPTRTNPRQGAVIDLPPELTRELGSFLGGTGTVTPGELLAALRGRGKQ